MNYWKSLPLAALSVAALTSTAFAAERIKIKGLDVGMTPDEVIKACEGKFDFSYNVIVEFDYDIKTGEGAFRVEDKVGEEESKFLKGTINKHREKYIDAIKALIEAQFKGAKVEFGYNRCKLTIKGAPENDVVISKIKELKSGKAVALTDAKLIEAIDKARAEKCIAYCEGALRYLKEMDTNGEVGPDAREEFNESINKVKKEMAVYKNGLKKEEKIIKAELVPLGSAIIAQAPESRAKGFIVNFDGDHKVMTIEFAGRLVNRAFGAEDMNFLEFIGKLQKSYKVKFNKAEANPFSEGEFIMEARLNPNSIIVAASDKRITIIKTKEKAAESFD